MPTTNIERRKIQKKKCQGKQLMLLKAKELIESCKLNVNMVFYDEDANLMQEFRSSNKMSAENIAAYKARNQSMVLDSTEHGVLSRRNVPRKNCIEVADIRKILQGYTRLKKKSNRISKNSQTTQSPLDCKKPFV